MATSFLKLENSQHSKQPESPAFLVSAETFSNSDERLANSWFIYVCASANELRQIIHSNICA